MKKCMRGAMLLLALIAGMRYNRLFDWDRDGKLEPDELRRMDEYLNDDGDEIDGEEEHEDRSEYSKEIGLIDLSQYSAEDGLKKEEVKEC